MSNHHHATTARPDDIDDATWNGLFGGDPFGDDAPAVTWRTPARPRRAERRIDERHASSGYVDDYEGEGRD